MSEPAAGRPKSDLPTRAGVGILLITLALLALWSGGIALWVLTSVAAMFMLAEWADLTKVDAKQKRLALYAACVPLAIMSPLAAGPSFFALGLTIGAAFFVTIVTRHPQLGSGVAYVSLPALALLFVRGQPDGLLLTFWVLVTVWATDIGAYFAGRAIGGPKLSPKVSPNKTWAGLIGGVALTLLVAVLLHRTQGLPLDLVFASPILGVSAQIGDLYESWLKRRAGVKDSGTILPGHGGVLDRLDGLVPVAPAAAMLLIVRGIA